MIRAFLVGAVRVNRDALAALLARDGRIEVSVHAGFPDTGGLRRSSADVVIVDVVGLGDLHAVEDVAKCTEAPIVVLGAPDDDEQVLALAAAGVLGFVEREAVLEDLVAAVVSAARDEASFPPRIATTLLRRVSSFGLHRSPVDAAALTVRERQVVQLIAESLSNKEIAARLTIEVATVKNHVHNILEKLDVSRRSEAVARLRVVENDRRPPSVRPAAVERSTTRSRAG